MTQRLTRIPGGLLVAIEGIDGAGKTTIATVLAQYCGEHGIACTLSKEPTSLRWGRELRRSASEGRLDLSRELELFELDRGEHVDRSVQPALAESNVVILDRYYWSTAAYQGSRGADPADVIRRNETFAPVPHLTILLDVDAQTGVDRIVRRGDTPNLFESAEPLSRARAIFLDLARAHTDRCVIVDASVSLREMAGVALTQFLASATDRIVESGLSPEEKVAITHLLLGGDALA